MLVDLETSDLWLVDDDLVLGLLGLEVAKGASSGQSAGENSERTSDGIIEAVGHFSDGCGLVDLSSSFNDPLLFVDVRRLVVLADLVALAEPISHQNGARVSEVGNETSVVVDEDDNCATAAVVTLLPPLAISLKEGFSQG